MSDLKQAFLVTTCYTTKDGSLTCPLTRFYVDKDEARAALGAFRHIQDPIELTYLRGYEDSVHGDVKTKTCVDGIDTFPTTGGKYYGTFERFEIDTSDLQEAAKDYEVILEVTRTHLITINVCEQPSEEDAYQAAKDELSNGEHEDQFDYPEDECVEEYGIEEE